MTTPVAPAHGRGAQQGTEVPGVCYPVQYEQERRRARLPRRPGLDQRELSQAEGLDRLCPGHHALRRAVRAADANASAT